MDDAIPRLALSVRQPWAWAIVAAGKDAENRDWRSPNPGLKFRGRVAIHAASGLTRDEYANAADFMRTDCGVTCAEAHNLVRGAIIGSVDVVDVVRFSGSVTAEHRRSPWFIGPVCLILRNPAPCEPIPCKGALGFFAWQPGDPSCLAQPARWMRQEPQEGLL